MSAPVVATDIARATASRLTVAVAWRRTRDWLSGNAGAALPVRVQRELDAQRRQNEILIGWVQAALMLTFALLYAFSRKTFANDAMLRPVPLALGVYAVFVSYRIYLAYQGRLTIARQILSVIADNCLLMITIWSFHLQYGQPVAFSLKAPTLFYVFIFIALRTLTLMPGMVLLAGAVAALGWLGLVGIAINAPGGMDLITRDYVQYLTSIHVLVGGEIDKVISILLVSVILAIASARAGALLHRSVAGQAAAMQLARFFSPDIAATIVNADEILKPGSGRQTEAAAMFIDMRGFTRLAASLPPTELVGLLGEYQKVAVPVIQKHGGSVITYLGDGIMVTFGATRPSLSYAADALRATAELLDALEAWAAARRAADQPAPGVGIGVEVGTVTCGAIGDDRRLEYAVIGDPVNRAAKLQNHTKVEQVKALASSCTLRRALAQGFDAARCVARQEPCNVTGIADPLILVVIA